MPFKDQQGTQFKTSSSIMHDSSTKESPSTFEGFSSHNRARKVATLETRTLAWKRALSRGSLKRYTVNSLASMSWVLDMIYTKLRRNRSIHIFLENCCQTIIETLRLRHTSAQLIPTITSVCTCCSWISKIWKTISCVKHFLAPSKVLHTTSSWIC